MSTPLRIARDLRLAFPQFQEVRIVREAPWVLRAYCLIVEGRPAPSVDVERWVNANHMLGTTVHVEQVISFPPDLVDEEVLLRRTNLKRIVVEEADVSRRGLLQNLQTAFPDEVLGISEPGKGIAVHVVPELPTEREQTILDATRVLTICDFPSLVISRQVPPGAAPTRKSESKETIDRLREDRQFLEDYLPDVLEGEPIPYAAKLPSGAATYASPHDGVESILHRLALFEHVFAFVPFKEEDFPAWAGATFDEFIASLPTGRIVPVFSHTADRYEPGLISKILDAGAPRVLLPAEVTLRAIETFAQEHPLLTLFRSSESEVQQSRAALAELPNDPKAALVRGYVEAIADIAGRVGTAAMTGPALAMGWHPVAQWLDGIATKFGLASRELELGTAIDHRIMTEAFGGRPMTQVGHYLDGHLRFVYGAKQGEDDLIRVPDPELIGRIAFPDTKGLTVREFAESFRGSVVDAMRALVVSDRVQTAASSEDLVKRFNAELKQYARRTDVGYTAVGTLLTVVGAFVWGVPVALGALSLELGRRLLGRKAPAAFASLTSKMTRTSREAALLARIKAG